ncbi:MAG: hypothetical protein JRH05_04385 [Deltaproteobacteria bacterium]|nr:hypothetical protein [Deltaproteobacteria bacterium]
MAIAVYRRFILGVPRLSTGPMDVYALVILALIMLSGVLLEGVKMTSYSAYDRLEGVKMTSYSAYDRMVQEYADTDDPAELKALEAYWVHTFGIVSPKPMDSVDSDLLEQGRELHEMSCMACHDAPGWAFSGYVVAKAVRPMALFLDGWSRFSGYPLVHPLPVVFFRPCIPAVQQDVPYYRHALFTFGQRGNGRRAVPSSQRAHTSGHGWNWMHVPGAVLAASGARQFPWRKRRKTAIFSRPKKWRL